MTIENPLNAAKQRINRIHTVQHQDDLGEVKADAEGFLDALHQFDHIPEDVWLNLHRELHAERDKAAAKLAKKLRDRRR